MNERWTLFGRVALSALGGALVYTSYDPLGWWPAAIAGAGLLYASLRLGRLGAKAGALVSFAFGLGLYLLMLPWVGEFVGPLPFIALAVIQAAYCVPVGLAAVITRGPLGPLAFATWFVAVEWFRSSWPFGGFAWGRVGWGQVDGPLAGLTRFGGPALVTFATMFAGALLVELVLAFVPVVQHRKLRAGFAAAGVVTLAVCSVVALPRYQEGGPTVRVAAVQGNVPRMGLDFNAQRRAVLQNHVNETKRIGEPVDAIIWPENSSDVNPFVDRQAGRAIDDAVHSANAPILVGTLTVDEVGQRNTMVVMDPRTGVGDRHFKKYLQPFGEYMPFREFLRLFSKYVDMAGNFKPGDGDGTVRMRAAGSGEEFRLGIATCYEVAFDASYRDAVKAGAQVLATPTNNATFGFTDMTYQQLAMSRMRAIETDRAVAVAATSGASAIVRPDGHVESKTGIFQNGHLVADLPLRSSVTPAVRYGDAVQLILSMMGVLFVGAALVSAPLGAGRRKAGGRKSG